LKAFFIRLLQVTWVLSIIISVVIIIWWAGYVIIEGDLNSEDFWYFIFTSIPIGLGVAIVWIITLIAIQYLALSKLSPFDLFNDSLTKKR
jgi:hypothetical protein